jgi:dipeptidyl aminopeptidase/acylaminoacyl peptidase
MHFHVVFVAPGFDESRRYPVLVKVYGGPGSQVTRAQNANMSYV